MVIIYAQNIIRNVHGKISPFPHYQYALTHWKCVLLCCDKYSGIVILNKESNMDDKNMCTKIYFHFYRVLSWCTVHCVYPYKEKTTCSLCSTVPETDKNETLFTLTYGV